MLRKVLLVALAALVVADLASATNYCRCGPKEAKVETKKKYKKEHDSSSDDHHHHYSDDDDTEESRHLTNCYTRICKDHPQWDKTTTVCSRTNVCSNGPYDCDSCPTPGCDKAGGICVKNCKRCVANCKSVSFQTNVPFLDPLQCTTVRGDCPGDQVCCKSSPPKCASVGGECFDKCGAREAAKAQVVAITPNPTAAQETANGDIEKAIEALAKELDVDEDFYAPSIGTCPDKKICCIVEDVLPAIPGPYDPAVTYSLADPAVCAAIKVATTTPATPALEFDASCKADCSDCCAEQKLPGTEAEQKLYSCKNVNSVGVIAAADAKSGNDACMTSSYLSASVDAKSCCICTKNSV